MTDKIAHRLFYNLAQIDEHAWIAQLVALWAGGSGARGSNLSTVDLHFSSLLSLCKIVVLHHRIKGIGKLQKDFFTRKLTEPPGTVTSLM